MGRSCSYGKDYNTTGFDAATSDIFISTITDSQLQNNKEYYLIINTVNNKK